MNLNDLFTEEKVRLDPKCWTGKKIGNPKTKMKGGVRVNNCVPAESVNEMDKSQTPPGRDGSNDSDAGKKEYTAKPTTAKKVAKDAEKVLNKELNKKQGVAEGFPHDVDHMPGPVIRNADMTTDNVKTKDKAEWDRATDSINARVFDDMSEFRTDSKGETVVGDSAVWAKWDNATQTGWFNAKGRPLKPWPIKEQGVAEASDRIAANKQDRLDALENKLIAKGYTRTKDPDRREYQYKWTKDGAPTYVVNYRFGSNGYAEFWKEQGVTEGSESDAYGNTGEKHECGSCDGTGIVSYDELAKAAEYDDVCPECGGKGWVRDKESLKKKGVAEEASPMIKPPANRFDNKQEAFDYAKEHGGKVFKSTYIDPNTGIKNIIFVVKKEQGVAEDQLDEKSTSQAQFRTMAAAAHNPEFAKKVGISRDVAKEFHGADRKQDYADLPKKADESKSAPKEKEADYGDDYQAMVARVKKLAGLGPLKTVYDPQKRVYRNIPTAQQPKK